MVSSKKKRGKERRAKGSGTSIIYTSKEIRTLRKMTPTKVNEMVQRGDNFITEVLVRQSNFIRGALVTQSTSINVCY